MTTQRKVGIASIAVGTKPTTSLSKPQKSLLKKQSVAKTATKPEEGITIRLSQLETAAKQDLELDLQIQAERIIFILENTYKKLEIAACLPGMLLDRSDFLQKHLSEQHYEFILQTCDPFLNLHKSVGVTSEISALIDKISKYNYGKQQKVVVQKPKTPILDFTERSVSRYKREKKESVGVVLEKDMSPHLCQIIDILFNNEAVRANLDNYKKCIDENSALFLDCFRKVQECAKERFTTTAKEMRERLVLLRKAWKDNIDVDEEIHKLETILNKQRNEIGEQLEIKEQMCKEYEDKIKKLQQDFKENVRKRIKKSEEAMILDTKQSEIRQAELSEEAEKIKEKYNALLEQHLSAEKALRMKKFKTETQLASWLAKYDADVGDRNAEMEKLTEEFEKEREELEALQEKFDEQEEDYEILMAEKEEYEEAVFNEKRFEFIKNRSARKIQRYWRAYRERKKLKKARKRGKKK